MCARVCACGCGWVLQLPSKIKDLEINQSLLQSYLQEIKKDYDQTLDDLHADLKSLQVPVWGCVGLCVRVWACA